MSRVRDLILGLANGENIYNKVARCSGRTVNCVVIGRKKSKAAAEVADQKDYVLGVAPKADDGIDDQNERIGVSYLPSSLIQLQGLGLKIHIFQA